MGAGTTRGRPTGRRAGDSGTRDAILDSALRLFGEHGYAGASVRAIAADAGVDPALVRHFFGGKEALFVAVVTGRTQIPGRLAAAFDGPRDGVGRRVTEAYLGLWEDERTRPVLLALVRSATTSPRAAQMLGEALSAGLHLDDSSGDPVRTPRVVAAGSQLFGVAVSRHVLRLPAIAAIGHDELVDLVAPTVQRYLAGPP